MTLDVAARLAPATSLHRPFPSFAHTLSGAENANIRIANGPNPCDCSGIANRDGCANSLLKVGWNEAIRRGSAETAAPRVRAANFRMQLERRAE